MKKKTAILVVSYLLALSVVMLGFTLKEKSKSKYYTMLIEQGYEKSLSDLCSALDEINTELEKSMYLTSGEKMNSVAMILLNKSEQAKNDLASLPNGEEELTVLNRFLSQIGNYALYISSKDDLFNESETLQKLYNNSKIITETINSLNFEFNNEKYWMTEINNRLSGLLTEDGLADAVYSVEESLTEYPTLIYDGPYADHITDKESKMLTSSNEIGIDEAKNRVAEYMNVSPSEMDYVSTEDSEIRSYLFLGENISAKVSVNGGYIVYFRKYYPNVEKKINYTKVLENAKKFLNQLGITNMVDTYYYEDEGVTVVNFAYRNGDIICYSDLIKVGVSMENGEIVLFEGGGYITNHREREIEEAEIGIEEAKEKLSPLLTVKSFKTALIPKKHTYNEILCYEFVCDGAENREIIVYINAISGEEEEIFLRIDTSGGTLVK